MGFETTVVENPYQTIFSETDLNHLKHFHDLFKSKSPVRLFTMFARRATSVSDFIEKVKSFQSTSNSYIIDESSHIYLKDIHSLNYLAVAPDTLTEIEKVNSPALEKKINYLFQLLSHSINQATQSDSLDQLRYVFNEYTEFIKDVFEN